MGKYDPGMGGVEIGPTGGPGDPAIFGASDEACLLACFALLLLCFVSHFLEVGRTLGVVLRANYVRAGPGGGSYPHYTGVALHYGGTETARGGTLGR